MTRSSTSNRIVKYSALALVAAAVAAPGAGATTGLCPYSYQAPPGGGGCPVTIVAASSQHAFDGPRAAGPQGWQIGAYSHDSPRSGPVTTLPAFPIEGPRSGPASLPALSPADAGSPGSGSAVLAALAGTMLVLLVAGFGVIAGRRRRRLAGA